jgi:hypothetical protein
LRIKEQETRLTLHEHDDDDDDDDDDDCVFWELTHSVLVDSYQNLEKPDASSFRLEM